MPSPQYLPELCGNTLNLAKPGRADQNPRNEKADDGRDAQLLQNVSSAEGDREEKDQTPENGNVLHRRSLIRNGA